MGKKNIKGITYLLYALWAFGGIGLELVLAFGIEPTIYGVQLSEFSVIQYIIHWIIICIIWGLWALWIIRTASKDLKFNIMQKTEQMKIWQWLNVIVLLVAYFVFSYFDWNHEIKFIHEFHSNGMPKFIFQFIYYFFEVLLFSLVIIFGQKTFEKWFHRSSIPYGGILVGLTWGLGHILSKGSITIGILSCISGFAFGGMYLLVNRDFKKTLILLYIMFALGL